MSEESAFEATHLCLILLVEYEGGLADLARVRSDLRLND